MDQAGEFSGRDFQYRLLQRIISQDNAAHLSEASRANDETHVVGSSHLRKFIRWFNRRALRGLSQFFRINLRKGLDCNKSANNCPGGKSPLWSWPGDRPLTGGRHRKWPYVVLAAHILNTTRLLVQLYYQYIYDANQLKLARLQANTQLSNHTKWRSMQLVLERKVTDARESLETIGASHFEWSFWIEPILLFYLIIANLYMVVMPMFYSAHDDLVVFSSRFILDDVGDAQIIGQLMIDELQRFAADSRLFIEARTEDQGEDLWVSMETSKQLESVVGGSRRSSAEFYLQYNKALVDRTNWLLRRHREMIDTLKSLALAGRLNPLNRSPACRDRLNLVSFVAFMSVAISQVLVVNFFRLQATSLFAARDKHVRINGFGSCIGVFSLISLIAIPYLASLFIIPLLFVTACDQVATLTHLRKLICSTKETNEVRYHKLRLALGGRETHEAGWVRNSGALSAVASQERGMISEFGRALEEDLLVVIVQCRMTARLFEMTKKFSSSIALLYIYIAISPPIIMRIHSAYFPDALRAISLRVPIPFIVTGFLFQFAIVHEYCLNTFETLWGLVATLTRIDLTPSIRGSLMMSTSMAAFTLRRGQFCTGKTMERFAYRVLSLPITYRTLMTLTFSIVVVMASLLDSSNRLIGDAFGGLLKDPFGLLDPEPQ